MPRLMIVDDEPEITAMLKRYFVREGYETVTALTGAEALRKLCCAPDMVLLDDELNVVMTVGLGRVIYTA